MPRGIRFVSKLDPRWYQIASLAALLAIGIARLGFEVPPGRAAAILGAALLAQWACQRHAGQRFEPRSALISGLSLCLLLRSRAAWVPPLAAGIAIVSKFAIRIRGKHLFNPTNLALMLVLALGWGWVSPGQWGHAPTLAFLAACLGGVVVQRAARADVTLAFLVAYAGLLFGRALWLGQAVAVPLHQLESGALLLFAFFMISDPRTTPDTRRARVLFAVAVACGAAFVPFVLYRTNGLLWSLAFCSPLVPLLDRWMPGPRYSWASPRPGISIPRGGSHATSAARSIGIGRLARGLTRS